MSDTQTTYKMTTKKTPATPTPITMTGQNKIVQDNFRVIYDQIKDLREFAEFSHDRGARLEEKLACLKTDMAYGITSLQCRIEGLELELEFRAAKIYELQDGLESLSYKMTSVIFALGASLTVLFAAVIHLLH